MKKEQNFNGGNNEIIDEDDVEEEDSTDDEISETLQQCEKIEEELKKVLK